MEVTEEQRRRAESNRIAALKKRKRAAELPDVESWRLAKCRNVPSSSAHPPSKAPRLDLPPPPRLSSPFRAVLEICSPDEFSITPEPLQGSPFPGENECLSIIEECVASVVPFCPTVSQWGRRTSVFKLVDYEATLRCLKKLRMVELQEVPYTTRLVVEKFSRCFGIHWVPCIEGHYSDEQVDELMRNLPRSLRDVLLPFQIEGVRFGLRRGGRCLIADEMGLGKTIQCSGLDGCILQTVPVQYYLTPHNKTSSWDGMWTLSFGLRDLLSGSGHCIASSSCKFLHESYMTASDLNKIGGHIKAVILSSPQKISSSWELGGRRKAISIACCFHEEGPILVVCPAVLRYSWAEELEHWLPTLQPKDIHLVFGRQNNIDYLERLPKVVVISYTMLKRLRDSMIGRNWALMIVDESHNIRCTKKQSESAETRAMLEMARKIKRIILLSGTPSFSRPYDIYHQVDMLWPGLLGKNKYEYAKQYCSMKTIHGPQGVTFKDFSKGIRLGELNILLRQTIMIRRLKEHVLTQLPPKRRQIIHMMLKGSDILLAKTSCRPSNNIASNDKHVSLEYCTDQCDEQDNSLEHGDVIDENPHREAQKELSNQEIGIAKLSGFREWFSNHFTFVESEDADSTQMGLDSKKTIIFAHHLKVLDGIQELICEMGINFVRIDGGTLAIDRKKALEDFRYLAEVKIAIIGITVGGYGLDLSSAENVIFLELPKSSSELLQAEDRAHRQGQTKAVNIYIFCAKDTPDEKHWLHLNKSLFRVSSVINGKKDAMKEFEVDTILSLEYNDNLSSEANSRDNITNNLKDGCSARPATQSNAMNNDSSEEHESSIAMVTETNEPVPEVNEDSLVHDYLEANDKDRITGESTAGSSYKPVNDNKPFDLLENNAYEDDAVHITVTTNDEGKACGGVNSDADSLRFEVSKYTGRVHLYACIPGKDLRPRPLFENFRPEELESIILSPGICKERGPEILRQNPSYSFSFRKFIEEWNALRPIEQNKLIGKPLQLPLTAEFCYLKEGVNHGPSGLLKGGSNRRVTPLNDICLPLPENAVWKNITLCGGTAKEKIYAQAWTSTSIPLCKLCQQPCNGKFAKTPEYFEDLFCNLSCYQEYRIRTSQRALREELFQIEHGVCTKCKLDCHKLVKCIKPLSTARRQEYIKKFAPKLAQKRKTFEKLVQEPIEGNAWHADHIIPVYKGGGECTLENMRTLCVACHAEVTRAQRAELNSARKRAKKRLKVAIKELQYIKPFDYVSDVDRRKLIGAEAAEEELLNTKVPGSLYSTKVSDMFHEERLQTSKETQ